MLAANAGQPEGGASKVGETCSVRKLASFPLQLWDVGSGSPGAVATLGQHRLPGFPAMQTSTDETQLQLQAPHLPLAT